MQIVAVALLQGCAEDPIVQAWHHPFQIAGEPVSETATVREPARSSRGFSSPAAATIAVGSSFAPAVSTAV